MPHSPRITSYTKGLILRIDDDLKYFSLDLHIYWYKFQSHITVAVDLKEIYWLTRDCACIFKCLWEIFVLFALNNKIAYATLMIIFIYVHPPLIYPVSTHYNFFFFFLLLIFPTLMIILVWLSLCIRFSDNYICM